MEAVPVERPSAARMQARQAALRRQGLGRMPRWGHNQSRRPNKRVELTPLRGPKIAAILTAGIGSTAFPIEKRGATHAQGVGRTFARSSAFVYTVCIR